MGVDLYVLKSLLDEYERRGPFGAVLHLGRQGLYISESDCHAAETMLAMTFPDQPTVELFVPGAWADVCLLPLLGATSITTLDAAAHEGATLLQDMNEPVTPDLWTQFDTILDG